MAKSAASPCIYFNMTRFLHTMAAKPYVPVSASGG